jgi:hypothetical protein
MTSELPLPSSQTTTPSLMHTINTSQHPKPPTLLIDLKDVSNVIASGSPKVVLPKYSDDDCTKKIERFTSHGLTDTNVLVHNIHRETVHKNANCSNALLKSQESCSTNSIISKVRIHILNNLHEPQKHMRTHKEPAPTNKIIFPITLEPTKELTFLHTSYENA